MYNLIDIIDILTEEEMEFPVKEKKRAKRRKNDYAKARRKEKIAAVVYPGGYHAPHGYFKKGKIHCSCPLCAAKTNGKPMKHLGGTYHKYDKYYKPSDLKKVDRLMYSMEECYVF